MKTDCTLEPAKLSHTLFNFLIPEADKKISKK